MDWTDGGRSEGMMWRPTYLLLRNMDGKPKQNKTIVTFTKMNLKVSYLACLRVRIPVSILVYPWLEVLPHLHRRTPGK